MVSNSLFAVPLISQENVTFVESVRLDRLVLYLDVISQSQEEQGDTLRFDVESQKEQENVLCCFVVSQL